MDDLVQASNTYEKQLVNIKLILRTLDEAELTKLHVSQGKC